MDNYYVYQLVDPRTGKPFYVGEGKDQRAWSHQKFKSGCHNPHKDRFIRKIQSQGLEVIVEFLYTNLTKEQSTLIETKIIDQIGLENLTNIVPNSHPPILHGKENGFYGKTHTEENKRKCGDANRGKDLKTEQGKNSIRDSMIKRWQDPEQRKNQIQALKNRRGEKRSPQAIESYKNSAANRIANSTPEQRSEWTQKGIETKRI